MNTLNSTLKKLLKASDFNEDLHLTGKQASILLSYIIMLEAESVFERTAAHATYEQLRLIEDED